MSIPTPDFRRVVADFEELTTLWQRRTEELRDALSLSGAVEEHEHFTLRTIGVGQVAELTFQPSALETSPVQLREELLAAHARLSVGANAAQAGAIARILEAPEIADGITAAVPQQMRERAAGTGPAVASAAASATTPVETATAEQVLAWAQETAAPTIVSSDMAETMSDVEGWSPRYQGIDPQTTQYELEKQVEQISSKAAALRPLLEQLEVSQSSKYLTVVVSGAGALTDIRFRPAFRGAGAEQLSKDFAKLYAAATHEASARTTQQLVESGLGSDDDPTEALLQRFDTAADELLARFDRP